MRDSAKEVNVDLQHRRLPRRKNLRFSRKTGLLLLLALLTIVIPTSTRFAHGTSGILYVSPSPAAHQSVGSNFTVQIKVSGIGSFGGWDISVQSDPAIISPVNFDITRNLLAVNFSKPVFPLASCLNNVGTGCNPAIDGPGVVTSTTYTFGTPPPNPTLDGLLFTITYKVTGTGNFSPVHMMKDLLSNGANLVSHSTTDGAYGVGPGFDIGATPTSMSVRQGLNSTGTVTVFSINQFAGTVSLTVTGDLSASFVQNNLPVSSGASESTTVTFETNSSTAVTGYHMIITGSSNGISISILIDVTVNNLPYFILSSQPGLLLLHQGTSGSSIITAQSVAGFSGSVNLTAASPQGVIVQLNTTTLKITPEKQAKAALTITVPPSQLPFKYLINVTGISGSTLSSVSQIIVQPPRGTFSVNLGSGSVRIGAGGSANSTITISSQDYLLGFVYIGAIMNGGAASLNATRVFILPSGTASITIHVSIGAKTPPGSYVLLLTLYQIGSQPINVPLTIFVTGGFAHSGSLILGLSPLAYFGILGILAIILVLLSVQTYRKREH